MGLLSFRRKEEAAGQEAFNTPAADPKPRAKRRAKAAEPIDPVLPEKQRARRRLIGAVALVLAAVIGLPMILDPEPKPVAGDINIDIPSKERAATRAPTSLPASAALDKREEIVSGSDLPAAAASKPEAALAVTQPKADNTAAKDEAQAKPEAKPEAKADAKADGKADIKADAKADTKADTKAAAKPESPKHDTPRTEATAAKKDSHAADEARARALLDGKSEPAAEKAKAASEKPERYLVQVAALASQEKVQELQNKLKAAGIKSSTQKVATQSGERIRVRVGPVQGRAEAEKMRQRLAKLGLNGTLVPA